ncbi:MAG: transglycosylase SLT domain-containing protein [Acidobacteria bacterium]|nr:transglycosylase SLT domain-containing protein [Acidobacteriota bacterium]
MLALCATASAQAKPVKVAAPPTRQAGRAGDLQALRQNFIRSAEEYRVSLRELATSYEGDLHKAEERQEALRGLYTDGVITRVEFEKGGTAVADAQAKVDDVRRQIAQAEETIAAARRPVEALAAPDAVTTRAEPAWTTGSARIDGLIRTSAQRHGVDPYLVFCVMNRESGFYAGATSPVGAAGLMQLMPATATRYGVRDIYDPAQNIEGGTRYLSDLLKLFGGRVDLALAGYNAGEGAVMKYGNRVPPYAETQNYVRAIGGRYTRNTGVQLTAKTSARGRQGQGN